MLKTQNKKLKEFWVTLKNNKLLWRIFLSCTIMTNATKYALIEGLLPFSLAIVIVALIDVYEYRCEKEDKINLDELENRIEKLEGNQDER